LRLQPPIMPGADVVPLEQKVKSMEGLNGREALDRLHGVEVVQAFFDDAYNYQQIVRAEGTWFRVEGERRLYASAREARLTHRQFWVEARQRSYAALMAPLNGTIVAGSPAIAVKGGIVADPTVLEPIKFRLIDGWRFVGDPAESVVEAGGRYFVNVRFLAPVVTVSE
jgi:hypothetical protein